MFYQLEVAKFFWNCWNRPIFGGNVLRPFSSLNLVGRVSEKAHAGVGGGTRESLSTVEQKLMPVQRYPLIRNCHPVGPYSRTMPRVV